MKRITFLILSFLLSIAVCAQNIWTIESVPNTRLESNDIHVSDPDEFLSDSAEMRINTALCAIRDKADVFVVTLASIGSEEPKRFATALFNKWGIGDAETNNGVLLLFVEDQHALEFETGYGAEATMTDARCQMIFTNTIVPFFRVGDYEGGLCAGVAEIVTVYGGTIPDGLKTNLPSQYDEGEDADFGDFPFLLGLFGLMVFIMPIVGLIYLVIKMGTGKNTIKSETYKGVVEDGVTYISSLKPSWSGSPWEGKGCVGALILGLSPLLIFIVVYLVMSQAFPDMIEKRLFNWVAGISLFCYFTWICFRQNQRALKVAKNLAKFSIAPQEIYKTAFNYQTNKCAMWIAPWLGWVYYLVFKSRIKNTAGLCCPNCSQTIHNDRAFHLPEMHETEQRIGALHFKPFCCGNGHEYVVREEGPHYKDYVVCDKCGALAASVKKTIVREATYQLDGECLDTYSCKYCGETYEKTVTIPRKIHTSSSGGGGYSSHSSSGRSYSRSSSRSSHGSFGGGRSGGGGYSGRW